MIAARTSPAIDGTASDVGSNVITPKLSNPRYTVPAKSTRPTVADTRPPPETLAQDLLGV